MIVSGVDMPLCMRFWTHMFGNGIGTLSIHLQDTRDSTEQQIWSLTGEAGNAWYQAEVPVSSANTFKVLWDPLVDIKLVKYRICPLSRPTLNSATNKNKQTSFGACLYDLWR